MIDLNPIHNIRLSLTLNEIFIDDFSVEQYICQSTYCSSEISVLIFVFNP